MDKGTAELVGGTRDKLVEAPADAARQPLSGARPGGVDENPLRRAAWLLGMAYSNMARNGDVPLGDWAVPGRSGPLNSRVLLGLDVGIKGATQLLTEPYRNAFFAMKPKLEGEALRWARKTLARQEVELVVLDGLIAKNAGRLHEAAKRAMATEPTLPPGGFQMRSGESAPETGRRGARESRARALVQVNEPLLFRIFPHPDAVGMIETLAADQARGVRRVREAIGASRKACGQFSKALDTERIWRYPPALVGATVSLGISDLGGMPEYAVALGMVLGRTWWDKALDHAGNAILGIEVAGGPVGVVVAEILDVVLSGAQWLTDFLRAAERDVAALATDFAAEHERMGEHMSGFAQAASLFGSVGLAAAPYLPGGARKLKGILPSKVPDIHAPPIPRPRGSGVAALDEIEDVIAAERRLARDVEAGKGAKRLPAPSELEPIPRREQQLEAQAMKTFEKGVEFTSEPVVRRAPPGGALEDTARTGKIKLIAERKVLGSKEVLIHGQLDPGLLARKGKPRTGQLKARNFNNSSKLIRPEKDLEGGFRQFQWAHLWGPRLGDEAAAGLMLAHPSVNAFLQSHGEFDGIEGMIEQIAEAANELGGKAVLTARARAFSPAELSNELTHGADFLQSVTYEVTVIKPNGGSLTWTASITCAKPPAPTSLDGVHADSVEAFVEKLFGN